MTSALETLFDHDETYDAWQAHLQEIGAPPADLVIPQGGAYRQRLELMNVPEEDIPEVIASREAIVQDPALDAAVRGTAWSLTRRMGEIWMPPSFPLLKDINDPRFRFIWLHMLAMVVPRALAYHRQLGIPAEISEATMADIGRNVRVHRKRENIGGLGVAWWLRLHVRGLIYDLGRLQFERVRINNDAMVNSMRRAGLDVESDTPVLSVHVPDFSGPVTPAACAASIARAQVFFPRYFPEVRQDIIVCYSWLLDEALQRYLKPASNILQFQKLFTLTDDDGWDSTESVMQFVFGRKVADIDSVPQESSLQRGVVDHIRGGNSWRGKAGWMLVSAGGPGMA